VPGARCQVPGARCHIYPQLSSHYTSEKKVPPEEKCPPLFLRRGGVK